MGVDVHEAESFVYQTLRNALVTDDLPSDMGDDLGDTEIQDATMMMAEAIKAGDNAEHPRFGKVKVEHIDDKTYSIPMVVFEVLDGNLKGEKIIRPQSEFPVSAKKK